MATIPQMRATANQIQNETQVGGNTAARVGGLFNDVVDKLESNENNITSLLSDVNNLNDDVYGTNPIHETIAPTDNAQQGANRWLLRWYNVLKNGDIINISCRTGYEVSVFLYDVDTVTIIKSYTNSMYQNSLSITYEDGENQDFRVLVRKSNNGNISSSEVIANVTYSVTRYVYGGGLVGDVADLQNDVSNINGDINSLDGRVDTIEQDMQSSQVNILPTMGTNYFEIGINTSVTPNIFETLHSSSKTYQSVLIPAIRGKRYVIEVSATQYAGFALIKNSNPSVGDNVVYPAGQEMHYTNLTASTYTFDVTEDNCYFFVRNDIGESVRTWPQKFYYENNQARFIERSELLNEVVPNSDEPVKSSAVYNFASKKEIKILFIGNSLTQDATMWLPYVLRNIGTGIKYTLINMYNGGYTLTQQWTKINGGQKFEIASVCDNANGWTNYNNSKTLDDMLSVCEFDYLVLQEYYNYKASAEDTDLSAFNNIVDYVMNRVSHPFEVVTLIHAPKRDDATTIYNRTVAGNQLILRETCATSLINIGTAIYEALDTDLDSLGTQGHLSPDGTHAQEGLPCILETLNIVMWIYEKLGIAGGVVNFQFSPTPSSIYSSLNVAGANGSVIDGTTAQQQLATKVAADSYKKNMVIFMEAFING